MFSARTPVVAAVQGAAIGGGLGLALAADFRVGTPEHALQRQLRPARVPPRLRADRHAAGSSSATSAPLELLYTGARLNGEAAHAIGLLDRLVPVDELDDAAARASPATSPRPARSRCRASARRSAATCPNGSAPRPTASGRSRIASAATADFAEGVRAMAERRPHPSSQGASDRGGRQRRRRARRGAGLAGRALGSRPAARRVAVALWPTRAGRARRGRAEWYGRGLPGGDGRASSTRSSARAGAVGLPVGVGTWLAAPTLLAHGSDELKRRVLRPTLTGEHTWCQLFSEPGNGSDLAGLYDAGRARRRRVGRQRPEGVEHERPPRRLRHAPRPHRLGRAEAPGHHVLRRADAPAGRRGAAAAADERPPSFNEVFLTDARVPHDNVVGDVGDGWPVALTTLAHERRLRQRSRRPRFDDATPGRARRGGEGRSRRLLQDLRVVPAARRARRSRRSSSPAATGRNRDPVVRQQIAALLSHAAGQRGPHSGPRRRGRSAGRPGPEGSLGKLASSNVARAAAALHATLAGADGMLAGADGVLDGVVAEVLVSVPAQSIAGGTDEIQRNIIGERVLGLPRDPRKRPQPALPPDPPLRFSCSSCRDGRIATTSAQRTVSGRCGSCRRSGRRRRRRRRRGTRHRWRRDRPG